ncbi:phage tail protein [Rosenbergiella nectarea]|uniref:phage tail protein n=1 Tax=Rosenbergiella nectarea TaxID=988801 RepID=UPI001BD9C717|nr:phage tail protein [Rosenbergiella nectarea]MBT0729515.1 phage tail protein [Rosenbergiella nectarea subsp. apis]
MADKNLKTPVKIQAKRIDATFLPKVFSPPYMLYVVQQSTDIGSVADKANDAGQGAYDSQVKNDEQDKTLSSHESRIKAAEQELVDHEQRISQAEKELADHEQRIKAAETELSDHEKRISSNETELSDHEKRISSNETELSDHEKRISSNETELSDHEKRIKQNATDISAFSDAQKADSKNISNLQGDYLSKSQKTSQSISGDLGVTTSLSVNGVKVIGAQQTGWTAATGIANKAAFNADQAYTVGTTYSQTEVQAIIKALVETRQRVKAIEDMVRTHGLIA